MKNILVTGAFGQIGSELVPKLQKIYGDKNVFALAHKNVPSNFSGTLIQGNIEDQANLRVLFNEHKFYEVYHLVSLLSVKGEENPLYTWNLNINSLVNILELAREFKTKIFWPSSIAAFGPSTPRINTPQQTILEPTTMYGVTKVSGELLCQYYHLKFGVDARSLRFPGIISWKTPPGGGTTDYAVAIFYEGLRTGNYTCFVSPETTLPMMYMDDAIDATLRLMQAERNQLTVNTSYNLTAMSFSADQLAKEIQKHIPLKIAYKPDHRQKIADSWPKSIDDHAAQIDWNWKPKYDLAKMTEEMLTQLKIKFT